MCAKPGPPCSTRSPKASGRPKPPRRPHRAHRAEHRHRAARGAALAARGRRRARRRQGVPRAREGEGARRGRPREGQGAGRADGARSRPAISSSRSATTSSSRSCPPGDEPRSRSAPKGSPTGDHDGRPPGLRQDDDLREARALPRRSKARSRSSSPPTCSAPPPSSSSSPRRADRRAGLQRPGASPLAICKQALGAGARSTASDVIIYDTAGRLAIDEPLMDELADIKAAVEPENIFSSSTR